MSEASSSKRTPRNSDYDPTSTVLLEKESTSEARFDQDDVREMIVEVVGGPMDGKRQRLSGASFSIGRQETNDLSLALDPTVSNQHARILRDGDHFWLEDLESRNGTFVSEQRIVTRVLIGPGTVFFIGQTSLEFLPR